jgi:hypothetical protein
VEHSEGTKEEHGHAVEVMVNWYPTAKWPACEEHAIGVLMFNLWMQG